MEAIAAISAPIPQPRSPTSDIDRKAEEFEALILTQLLKPMFDTAKSPSLFGGDGPEEDAFSSMLQEHYANSIAARGGVGIADQVKDALIRLQSEAVTIQGVKP